MARPQSLYQTFNISLEDFIQYHLSKVQLQDSFS